MFNLIVQYGAWPDDGRDTFSTSRIFEYTEDQVRERFTPNGQIDLLALSSQPTLFMQEGQDNQVARVGIITRARVYGPNVTLEYAYDLGIPPLSNRVLHGIAGELNMSDFEFSRTHWAVKDVDLFRILLRHAQPRRHRPSVFTIAEHENIESTLISAMMPFDLSFDRVYHTLRGVAERIGFRCRRADDIWENPAVMQDVVSLIDRSKVVIADCTGRNPNVFYEIGIAHTLGRDVILLTQNEADIPFDLRHLRYVSYLNNNEGLSALSARLEPRLADLFTRMCSGTGD